MAACASYGSPRIGARALLDRVRLGKEPLTNAKGQPRRVWIASHVPYDLRHTHATWSLAAGAPSRDCAEEMGTSLEMFERHYGHPSREANPRNATRRANYTPGDPGGDA